MSLNRTDRKIVRMMNRLIRKNLRRARWNVSWTHLATRYFNDAQNFIEGRDSFIETHQEESN